MLTTVGTLILAVAGVALIIWAAFVGFMARQRIAALREMERRVSQREVEIPPAPDGRAAERIPLLAAYLNANNRAQFLVAAEAVGWGIVARRESDMDAQTEHLLQDIRLPSPSIHRAACELFAQRVPPHGLQVLRTDNGQVDAFVDSAGKEVRIYSRAEAGPCERFNTPTRMTASSTMTPTSHSSRTVPWQSCVGMG